jgi:DNA-binding XRE family transcriptional regulator
MPKRIPIPDKLFAAVREGKLTQAEAARRANVSRQTFNNRFHTFVVEQIRLRRKMEESRPDRER